MNISKVSNFTTSNKDKDNIPSWARDVNTDLNSIFLCLSGRIRFGANNNVINKGENVLGQFVTYTSNATPNTEDTVPHNLGSVPVGYIVISKDKSGDIYQKATTGTAWSKTNLYLKCTVASVNVTIFLLQ